MAFKLFLILVVSLQVSACLSGTSRSDSDTKCPVKHPIVIVPGIVGSRLYANLHNAHSPVYCRKSTSKDFLLFAKTSYFIYPMINCFTSYLSLNLNASTNTTMPPQGVTIKVKDWGDTKSIDYITDLKVGFGAYFAILTNFLVNQYKYERNVSLRGAPYDFRKAPNEEKVMLKQLKTLIEETYERNCQQRVILLAHSMGSLYALTFLHEQSQKWKDKYIQSYVTVGGPYLGSVKTVEAVSSGDNLNVPIIKPIWFKNLCRSWPSLSYMFPSPYGFSKDDPIAMTKKRNYTVRDFETFYKDVAYPQGAVMYSLVKNITQPLKAPGVEVHCIWSKGLPTPKALDWRKKKFPTDKPVHINDDGDGTVTLGSLKACLNWRGKQSQPVHTLELEKVKHRYVVREPKFIDYLVKLLKLPGMQRNKVTNSLDLKECIAWIENRKTEVLRLRSSIQFKRWREETIRYISDKFHPTVRFTCLNLLHKSVNTLWRAHVTRRFNWRSNSESQTVVQFANNNNIL